VGLVSFVERVQTVREAVHGVFVDDDEGERGNAPVLQHDPARA